MLDMNSFDMTCLFRTKEKRLGTCARQERVSRRRCRAYDGVVSRTVADTATYPIQVFKPVFRASQSNFGLVAAAVPACLPEWHSEIHRTRSARRGNTNLPDASSTMLIWHV